MSLGIVLDVAIGLVFTFLLLAIMVSGIQELIAGWLSLRGKGLRKGLESLLAGPTVAGQLSNSLFKAVYDHALVSKLSPDGLPAYVPARNFSLALFEALKDGSHGTAFSRIQQGIAALPEGTAKESLTAFVSETAGDLDALQKRIETWFDDGMDRLSGLYKRRAQYIMLALGLLVAVAFNVDSITLSRTLWTQPTVRAALVNAAQQFEASQNSAPAGDKDDIKKRLENARCQLAALPLPIGWYDWKAEAEACTAGKPLAVDGTSLRSAVKMFIDRICSKDGSGFWTIVGWLITAAAVSFGSPFWFAALQQLLKLRNAGPKPPRSDADPQGARS
jgi:hypothetical protein